LLKKNIKSIRTEKKVEKKIKIVNEKKTRREEHISNN